MHQPRLMVISFFSPHHPQETQRAGTQYNLDFFMILFVEHLWRGNKGKGEGSNLDVPKVIVTYRDNVEKPRPH